MENKAGFYNSFHCYNPIGYNIAESYMNGREEYLKAIGEKLELHSTFSSYSDHSDLHIVNHGILNHQGLARYIHEIYTLKFSIH